MNMSPAKTRDQNAVEKLTDWTNQPTLMDLKADLEIAIPSHNTNVSRVRNWLKLREGKFTGNVDKNGKRDRNRSSVQPKLVRRQAEWRYPALSEPFLSSDKTFNAAGNTAEDTEVARQNELLLNYQFRTKLNAVSFIDEYVQTAVDEGTVAVRLGWHRETEKVTKEVPVWNYLEIVTEEEMVQLQEAVALKQENPRGFNEQMSEELKAAVEYLEETGVPVVAEMVGTTGVEEERIVKNHPTLDVLHFENLYLDPSCGGDVDKATFAVISFDTSKAELLKDGRYKNLDKVLWSSNTPLANPDHMSTADESQQFKDDLRKRVVAYEYWGWYDIRGDEVLRPIVATWIGDTLIRMEENPFPDKKIPLVVVPYLPVRKSTHGEPDAELLEDNQAILGALMRGMIDLMGRSANGQMGMAKGMLDAVNRRRFDTGQNYEFNPNIHPNNGIKEHVYPEIPNSALTMVGLQNQEAEALTGVKAFSGGLSGEAYGEVAAGIRGILDAASKREMSILRRLAKGMEAIGTKIAAMNAVFLSEEEVVRITNEQYVTIRREDLAGNFDVTVSIATAEVDEQRAQDLGFMLQTLGNNMDPQITMTILAEIAELKRMPKLAHTLRNWTPQPDPFAEQMKQIELETKKLELEELRSKVELNLAKARKEMSEADQKDLDFVEQETGTKHARDMDRQGAQARANQDTEIVKSLLQPQREGERPGNIEAAVGYKEISDMLTNSA